MLFVLSAERTVARRAVLFFLFAAAFLSTQVFATALPSQSVEVSPTIVKVAGTGTVYGDNGDGGAATSAQMETPYKMAIDAAGNLYIADGAANRIRKVDTAGMITTFAGTGECGFSGDGAAANAAMICNPQGVAVDASGNVYISDTANNRIRKVDTGGTITTIAGNGAAAYSGDSGFATNATLNNPVGLALDGHGNLYIADYFNNVVRMVDTSGMISTVAGTGDPGFVDNVPALLGEVTSPEDVAVDAAGNLYIADLGNRRIRKVSAGIISTVAGNGVRDVTGPGDGGPAVLASVSSTSGIALDASGNLYIADFGVNRIRRVDSNGIISTVAGTGTYAYTGDGAPSALAALNGPYGVAVSPKGDIYVADANNSVVRKFSGSWMTTTVPSKSVGQLWTGTVAVKLNRAMTLQSVALSPAYVSASFADFATSEVTGCVMDGTTVNPVGSVCQVAVAFTPIYPGHRTAPLVLTDGAGNQYTVAIAGDATGSTVAYSPSMSQQLPATMFGVQSPTGVVFDNSNILYVTDSIHGLVTKYGFNGSGTTVNTGGIPTPDPMGVATDAQGNVYIVNYSRPDVVKVTPSGTATSIPVNANGSGLLAASGIAATDDGDLYVADTLNNRIVKITVKGVSSVLSTAGFTLNAPQGVAVDSKGNVYIADTADGRVVKVDANGLASVLSTGSIELGQARAIAVDSIGNVFISDSLVGRLVEVTTDGTASIVDAGGMPMLQNYGIAVAKVGILIVSNQDTNTLGEIGLIMAPQLHFADTAVGQTSSDGAKTVAVRNIGNAPLQFSTPSTGSNPSYPDGFPVNDTDTQLCAAGSILTVGAYCDVSANFRPTMAGNNAGSITLSSDMFPGLMSSASIAVSGTGVAGLDHFTVTAPPVNATAGTAFNVTVAAVNSSNQAVTSYTGTAHFTSSDSSAVLPADYTFTADDNGVHTFTVTLKASGSQSVSIADTTTVGATGQAAVQVNAGTPTAITITGGQGQSATIGGRFLNSLDVLLKDQYGNPVPSILVTFTSPSTGAGLYNSSTTRTSDYTGKASLYTLANGTAGSFQVVASSEGVSSAVTFNLTNTPGTTTATLAATPSSGATYGQSITLTATVTMQGSYNPTIARGPAQPRMADSIQVGPATGVVTFYDGTRLVGTANLGGAAAVVGSSRGGVVARTPISNQGTTATASVSINAPLGGDHSYTAVYAGDTNFGSSQTTAAVAVTVGPAAVTLAGPATQPVTVGNGQSATITVAVAAQSGATDLVAPTGTISYQIGTNGMQQAQVTNGQATLQVPNTLAVGSYSIQATYSGDSNYQAVATPTTIQLSVVSTVPPDFSLTANPTSLTIKAGDTGHATFTFTPVGGFTGTITFSCDNLPAGVTCTFAPATLTADGSNTVQTSQLTITTQRLVSANLYLPGALLGILLFWQRRRFNLRTAQVLMLVAGAAVIAGMVGCGSSPVPQSNASTSSVTVTAKATAGSGGTTSHSATFNLNITN